MDSLIEFRGLVDKILVERKHARKVVEEERERKEELKEKVCNLIEVQQFVQSVAETVQRHAHHKIAEIVTKALQTVFDDPYTFKIHFEQKRGRTEARLVFERRGVELSPRDCGGGVLDVAGFALRVAALLLNRPPLRKVLIMDEPFRFLSTRNDYRERVKELLVKLSEELEIQFIQVTHADELTIGKVIDL